MTESTISFLKVLAGFLICFSLPIQSHAKNKQCMNPNSIGFSAAEPYIFSNQVCPRGSIEVTGKRCIFKNPPHQSDNTVICKNLNDYLADIGQWEQVNNLNQDSSSTDKNADDSIANVQSQSSTMYTGRVSALDNIVNARTRTGTQTSNSSAYQAKDKWVSVDSAQIINEAGENVGSFGFGTEVTVYAEKLGYAKIDLAKERWVKTSDLSDTKPQSKPMPEPQPKIEYVQPQKEVASKPVIAKAPKPNPNNLKDRDEHYFIRYVSSNILNERSRPNGPVVNRVQQGQLLKVYGSIGKWYRVTAKSYSPRYVHSDYLSKSKPKTTPVSQGYVFSDSRIAKSALATRAGQYGLSQYDVETLWLGARHALNKGVCNRVEDGDKSLNKKGKYYLHCDGGNRFFSRSGVSINFD